MSSLSNHLINKFQSEEKRILYLLHHHLFYTTKIYSEGTEVKIKSTEQLLTYTVFKIRQPTEGSQQLSYLIWQRYLHHAGVNIKGDMGYTRLHFKALEPLFCRFRFIQNINKIVFKTYFLNKFFCTSVKIYMGSVKLSP